MPAFTFEAVPVHIRPTAVLGGKRLPFRPPAIKYTCSHVCVDKLVPGNIDKILSHSLISAFRDITSIEKLLIANGYAADGTNQITCIDIDNIGL